MRRALLRSVAVGGVVALVAVASTAASAARRPGCGTFCKQAGGLGAGHGDPGVTIRGADRSLLLSQGYVAVRVTCHRTTSCVGAVEIDPEHFPLPGGVPPRSYNGVDLSVGPGRTDTFLIPLLPAAAQLVHARGHLLVNVKVRLDDNMATSVRRTMTLRPA